MRRIWVFGACASLAVACGTSDVAIDGPGGADGGDASAEGGIDAARDVGEDVEVDAARDAGVDASLDAGVDATLDAGLDARVDSAIDTGVDAAIDTGIDAGVDAAIDAGVDAGVDATTDAGVDAAGDAGVDAPLDAPTDGPFFLDSGACNTLVNGGPSVAETQVPLATPVATGGTIALGTYYLTAWQIYTGVGGATGPTGNTRKTAFLFQPTLYMKVTADNGLGDENDSRTWSTQSTTLTSNQYCPTVDFLTSDYTATSNVLVLVANNVVLTFTKQ